MAQEAAYNLNHFATTGTYCYVRLAWVTGTKKNEEALKREEGRFQKKASPVRGARGVHSHSTLRE